MYPSRSAASASCPRSPARSSPPASAAQSRCIQIRRELPSRDPLKLVAEHRNPYPRFEILAASLPRFPLAANPPKYFFPPPWGRRRTSAANSRSSTSRAPAHSVLGPRVKAIDPPPALHSTLPTHHLRHQSSSPARARPHP